MGHGKIKIGSMAFSASQIGTLYGCGWNTMLELYNKYKGKTYDVSQNMKTEVDGSKIVAVTK